MDGINIDHLAKLSKLSFTDEEKTRYVRDMTDIIKLMDKVKEYDVVYDDTAATTTAAREIL